MDEQKRKQLKDQLKNNQNKLKAQMDENQEKARYGILMTEYERRVNDDDIEAYENMDNKIHGHLPGMGGSYERERQVKMVYQNFGRGNSTLSKHNPAAEVTIDHGKVGNNQSFHSMTPLRNNGSYSH